MPPPAQDARELVPGDLIAGKFRLERIIGRGGMGAIWAGRQVQLDMPVALKFIDAAPAGGILTDLAEAHARFEREARAAAQIRSPHVVQIIDHGIDMTDGVGRPYIAMELLEGEDLGQRLQRERRLSLPAAARIVTQIAKALRRAHDAGIIHRDLKPGNIFLARFDDDEVVKVLDFGVAKMRRPGSVDQPLATQVGVVFGSPSYMSPEQARGARNLDHRTDLWSLAVILFRSITGVKPFEAGSIADLVIKLCIDPIPVATRIAPHLPPAVDRFFERAFARDPAQRFASAPELAAAFEAVAASTGPDTSLASAAAPAFSQATGPHAGFATGTLTPASGARSLPSGGWGMPAPDPTPAPAPAATPVASPAPAPVQPAPHAGAPPVPSADAPAAALALAPPAAAPAPPRVDPSRAAAPPQPGRRHVIAALGACATTLFVVILLLAARHGSSAGSRGAAARPSAAPVQAVIAPAPSPSPSPSPSPPPPAAAPVPSAAPSTSAAAPEPSATADSAAAEARDGGAAAPEPGKGRGPLKTGKKRPNFGY